ncbi:hypothetical protein [Streptomyces sp. 049-1]|uniref:hypothetical protein n=1 Tax=Streptomyces sp. 049-1 TaxID=2789264 RepID=UPI00397F3DF9
MFEKQLGCAVEEAHPGWDDPFEAFWAVVVGDTDLADMRPLLDTYGGEMSPNVVDILSRNGAPRS